MIIKSNIVPAKNIFFKSMTESEIALECVLSDFLKTETDDDFLISKGKKYIASTMRIKYQTCRRPSFEISETTRLSNSVSLSLQYALQAEVTSRWNNFGFGVSCVFRSSMALFSFSEVRETSFVLYADVGLCSMAASEKYSRYSWFYPCGWKQTLQRNEL